MLRFKLWSVFLLLGGMIIFPLAAQDTGKIIGKVKAANLNVRVKPNTKFTAVCRLKYGSEVRVVRKQNEWLEIAVPMESAVWVSAFFLKDGKTTRDVKFRSGPGIAYQEYGIVPAGQEVKIIDDSNPEWKKVEPLPSFTAWVVAEYITLPPEALAKLDAPPIPAPKTDDKTASGTEPGGKPKEIELPFVAGYDKQVEYTGTLWPLEDQGKYATHALVSIKDKTAVPVCYLKMNIENPERWVNRTVKIKGTQKLVKDWALPLVIVDKDGISDFLPPQ